MRIETYLNTNKEEVDAKKFNIWIGISLGNKYFSKENIREYINWALKHTNSDILVVVLDDIYAINIEVFDKRNEDNALRRAKRKGDEKIKDIESILEELPTRDRKLVRIARWNEVINSKYHLYREELLFDEFKNNKEFHDYIIDIVKEGRKDRVHELSVERLDKLAEYVLKEIPLFINGVKYKTEDDGWKTYSLVPYPGLTSMDKLFIGLQNKEMFPELAERLKITDKIAILEAYVK